MSKYNPQSFEERFLKALRENNSKDYEKYKVYNKLNCYETFTYYIKHYKKFNQLTYTIFSLVDSFPPTAVSAFIEINDMKLLELVYQNKIDKMCGTAPESVSFWNSGYQHTVHPLSKYLSAHRYKSSFKPEIFSFLLSHYQSFDDVYDAQGQSLLMQYQDYNKNITNDYNDDFFKIILDRTSPYYVSKYALWAFEQYQYNCFEDIVLRVEPHVLDKLSRIRNMPQGKKNFIECVAKTHQEKKLLCQGVETDKEKIKVMKV